MKYHFKNPPISEVACSIQYEISDIDFAIQNQFYNKIKDRYPKVTDNPPLPYVYDRFSGFSGTPPPRKIPFVRYFFIDTQDSKLIQLQEGRFLFNWRKIEDSGSVYPKFDAVFGEFMQNWKTYSDILSTYNAKITINQLELTYVDHIPFSEFNTDHWMLSDILTLFGKEPLLESIDNANFGFSIPIEQLSGHLHISGHSGIRNIDKKAILALDSTARGLINGKTSTIEAWFTEAHDVIDNAFFNIISEKAKKIWGYTA